MSDLQERIVSLNTKVKELNSVRQKNIGRKEALLKQQEDAINAYNAKYGASITADTIKEEYERVSAEKAKEAEVLERIINAIGTGDYETANKLAGVEPPQAPSATANDAYVEQAMSSVGTEPVAENPNMDANTGVNTGASQMAQTAQALASTFAETGSLSGVAPTTAEPEETQNQFIPSPLGNPVNVESGEVKGIPAGSVFAKNFGDDDEDDAPAPPVAPPLSGFGMGAGGRALNAPVKPLGSLL